MIGAGSGGTATLTAPPVQVPSQGRTRERMAMGIHPVTGLGVADPQVTCGSCIHRVQKTMKSKTVTKCDLVKRRHGGPDIPADLRGCERFERPVPITVKVVADATVHEFWRVDVPEGMTGDLDSKALAEYLMDAVNDGRAVFEFEEVSDEHDREFVSVYTIVR